MSRIDSPSFSRIVEDAGSLLPGPGTYVWSAGADARTRVLAERLATDSGGLRSVMISFHSPDEFEYANPTDKARRVSLRDALGVASLLSSLEKPIYLDITSVPLPVWAQLLRLCIAEGHPVLTLYIEPNLYSRHSVPSPGTIFDLSERITGLAPVPGFARLRPGRDEGSLFVPILGFEGARLDYVLGETEPALSDVFPVLGCPGFRLEYPFFSLAANQVALSNAELYERILLARASCPFDLFDTLRRLSVQRSCTFLRIALLGTRPHALGAVLFALARPGHTELIYDYPVAKVGAAKGRSTLWVHDVSEFTRSAAFRSAIL